LLIEVMLENKEAITLDSTNNVFVGPEGYFKVMIDEFDGKAVKAWHIETAKGGKTGNLVSGEGTHIDVLVNGANRTVSHFVGRVSQTLFVQQQKQIAELQARLAELEGKK
jgi:hypothetical protein